MSIVKLQSRDMKILEADREAIMVSTFLKQIIEENEHLRIQGSFSYIIKLHEIGSEALQKIIAWCEHHKEDYESLEVLLRNEVLTNFDREFFNVNPDLLMDVINAAGALDIKALMDQSALFMSMKLANKTASEIRRMFTMFNAQEQVMRIVTSIDNATKKCNIL